MFRVPSLNLAEPGQARWVPSIGWLPGRAPGISKTEYGIFNTRIVIWILRPTLAWKLTILFKRLNIGCFPIEVSLMRSLYNSKRAPFMLRA